VICGTPRTQAQRDLYDLTTDPRSAQEFITEKLRGIRNSGKILTSSRGPAGPCRGWTARADPSARTAPGSAPPPAAPPRRPQGPPGRRPRRAAPRSRRTRWAPRRGARRGPRRRVPRAAAAARSGTSPTASRRRRHRSIPSPRRPVSSRSRKARGFLPSFLSFSRWPPLLFCYF
jgi:hypothetical protein